MARNWEGLPNKDVPIIFHAVFGDCEKEIGGTSFANAAEIEIVVTYVRKLLAAGFDENHIGIVAPYKNQGSKISSKLQREIDKGLEVGSVERFQGREKRIVIVSAVKSKTTHLGFLDNFRVCTKIFYTRTASC